MYVEGEPTIEKLERAPTTANPSPSRREEMKAIKSGENLSGALPVLLTDIGDREASRLGDVDREEEF